MAKVIMIGGRMYRALLCDLDGTAFDTERDGKSAWISAIKARSIELNHPEWMEFDFRLLLQFNGIPLQKRLELLEQWFPGIDAEIVKRYRAEVLSAVLSSFGVRTKPGIRELLEFFQVLDMPRGIVTSSPDSYANRLLESSGLVSLVDDVFGVDHVPDGLGKPHKYPYVEGGVRIGVPVSECLIAEDAEPGVKSGYSAGGLVLMVPDMVEPTAEDRRCAHKVFRSLYEVREYLAQHVVDV